MADEQEALLTEVVIETPPLSITCKQPGGDLKEVVKVALGLYREVFTPEMTRPGPGVGFTADMAE
jgi:hypothetical protein